MGGIRARTLIIAIQLFATDTTTTDLDDELDDMAEIVEAAMEEDPTFGGLLDYCEYASGGGEHDAQGERIQELFELQYVCSYRIAKGVAGTALT